MQKYPSIPYFNEVELKNFLNKPLVFTIKMDGSNAIMDRNGVTARNGHDATHPSFDMLKQMHAPIANRIPNRLQIFGEWLYAKHSIHYTGELALRGYFQMFGMCGVPHKFDDNYYYSWLDVEVMASQLGFETVQAYRFGTDDLGHLNEIIEFFDIDDLRKAVMRVGELVIHAGHEGVVVRNAKEFSMREFEHNILKYVRPDHVQTDEHWSHQPIVRNELMADGGA